MTVRRAAWLLVAALPLAGCARPGPASPVAVAGAWVRASAPGAGAGAAYFTLKSATGDRLVGVGVPAAVARQALVHETVRARGTGGATTLRMRHVASVDLPPGRTVGFAPGGRHVMLIGLARPLAPGDTVRLALAFERARPETVVAPVRME